MVMLRVAVVQLVNGSPIKLKTLQQPGINEFSECAIDRCRADIVFFTTAGKPVDQLIGVKMIMLCENCFDQEFSLARLSKATAL
mgnify:CR=1 FL=1